MNWKLLIWVPQFGIAIASPIAIFIFLAVWLRDKCDTGNWIIYLGIVLGVFAAYVGAKDTLAALNTLGNDKKNKKSSIYFNDHT